MLKANPLAAQNTADGIVLHERDQDAAHGDVPEYHRQRESRQHKEQIQLPVLAEIDQCVVQSAPAVFLVNKLFTLYVAFAQFLRIARKQVSESQQVAQSGACAFAHFHHTQSFDFRFPPMLLFDKE